MESHFETSGAANVGICLLGPSLKLADCNEDFKRIVQLPELKRESIGRILPSLRARLNSGLKKTLSQGIPVLIKDIPYFQEGSELPAIMELYLSPAIREGKLVEIRGILTVIKNTTDYIAYQTVADNMLQMVMDTIPQRIFWKDLNYRFLGCNKAFLQDAGLRSPSEIVGKTDYECVWKEFADMYRKDDEDVIKNGKGKVNFEENQVRPNGEMAWVRVSKVPIRDAFDKIVGVFGAYEDITEKKLAEQALLESEMKYRELIDFLPQTIFELDKKGFIRYISPNGRKSFGYNLKDLKKKLHGSVIIAPEEREEAVTQFTRVYTGEVKSQISEYQGIKKDGSVFPIAVSSAPIYKNGAVSGIRGIVFDLSEVTQVRQELMKERKMLGAFIDSLPDVSFLIDEDGRYVEFLTANEKLLLRPSSEMKDRRLHDFFKKEEADRMVNVVRETIKTQEPQIIEYNLITHSGVFAWFQARTSYFRDEVKERDLVIWTAREITELKMIQSELEEHKENLTITLESIGDAVIATDSEGKVVRMNAVAEQLTGWEKKEAIGRPVDEVFRLFSSLTDTEILNPIYKALKDKKIIELGNNVKILSRKGVYFQIADSAAPILKKDGSLFGAIVVFNDVTEKYNKERALRKSEGRLKRAQAVAHVGDWEYRIGGDKICGSEEAFKIHGLARNTPCVPLDEVIKNIHPEDSERIKNAFWRIVDGSDPDNDFDVEYRIFVGKAKTIRYVRSKAQIFSEKDGDLIILGTIQDITPFKQAEEELKVRNAELNNFVYRVSHDLRAPLSSIKGLLSLQRLHGPDSDVDYIGMMEKSINKLDLFIRDILSHSRNLNTMLQAVEVNFAEVINLCLEELEFMENFNRIEKDVQIQGGKYHGDLVRINEIFRNLISNGIKYSHPGRGNQRLEIDININETEALVVIQDNGIGIPHPIQTKVFDMFFRGHEQSEGSGIGLYIVKQAVQKLGGSILLESEPEMGSKFTLRLPNHLANDANSDLN